MNFGKNLQILRKMANMTQEELAEKINVSRQTISKWELGAILPEVEKLIELSETFHCSVDQLLKGNMDYRNKAYSDIKIVTVEPFRYISYIVISCEPEEDAISHVEGWAKHLNIKNPYIIGWDFPQVSQEQRNVFHMRGYGAALILEGEQIPDDLDAEIISQNRQKYITITLEKVPDESAFEIIPNAYKALMTYMAINGIREKQDPAILSCYEHEYFDDRGVKFMDIYIAVA
ncbi:MAG: helix-turn-helix domain-containing protein [Lachnospiraceae bacterium]|nr:helix-turn-helix domain-containing protein [Lachnospiraceae bacterium]